MRKKARKYAHVLSGMIRQPSELRKLSALHPLAGAVAEAFMKVKRRAFTNEEISAFRSLEEYRARLLASDEVITYEVFLSDLKRTVAEIARIGASPPAWCKLYYFLATLSGAENILEIGANLGISGQYFLAALKGRPGSKFVTMEGVPRLCAIASERFSELAPGEGRFEVIQGLYDDTLSAVVDSGLKFGLVFIDGNHRYEPTVQYFNFLKNNYSDPAILIFDDIHLSAGMERAWMEIKKAPEVVCSVDLFKLGIIVFEKSRREGAEMEAGLFLSLR